MDSRHQEALNKIGLNILYYRRQKEIGRAHV